MRALDPEVIDIVWNAVEGLLPVIGTHGLLTKLVKHTIGDPFITTSPQRCVRHLGEQQPFRVLP